MTGLFFCLASAEGAGLLFCPATIQPHTSVYSAFCAIHAVYTAHAVKQRTGFYRRIPCYLPCFAVAVWRCIRLYRTVYTTLERITAPQHLQRVPDTTATPGRCTAQHSRPIIIRYIRGGSGVPLLWIRTRQCSISQTMPARRGQLLPCADRWQVLHPAHLLRGQCLHLYRVRPAGSRCFPRLALV